MTSNHYHFITHWKVKSTCKQVSDILEDAEDLTRWWPSVYLDVKVTEPGDEHGIGKKVHLFTKGWLPYTLRWDFVVTNSNKPYGFSIQALGDFVGTGLWTFKQNGDYVDITYDWNLLAEKGMLKYLSFLLKPIFKANHHWAMRKGEESLRLEILRRNAKTESERNSLPKPPKPTFRW